MSLRPFMRLMVHFLGWWPIAFWGKGLHVSLTLMNESDKGHLLEVLAGLGFDVR